MQGYTYQPKSVAPAPESVVAPTVSLGEYAEVSKDVPLKMDRVQVKDSAERQTRAFTEAMAFADPTAPCALYTKDLRHGIQFEAFCAPIYPTMGENAMQGEQPRFPLVGLNW